VGVGVGVGAEDGDADLGVVVAPDTKDLNVKEILTIILFVQAEVGATDKVADEEMVVGAVKVECNILHHILL